MQIHQLVHQREKTVGKVNNLIIAKVQSVHKAKGSVTL